MESLKEIRNRIASVASTRQITNAMKMVAAAKLRKAQDAIIQMRPYADQLHLILTHLSDAIKDEEDDPYGVHRELQRILIVVIASNRGLCGSFNSYINKQALHVAKEEFPMLFGQEKIDFFPVGKKAEVFLKKLQLNFVGSGNKLYDDLSFERVAPVAGEIMQWYRQKKYDKVLLVYNQFKNAAVQILTTEQFLPVEIPDDEEIEKVHIVTDYIYEPSKDYIINVLIPKSLKIQFYKALLDSHAAEHGARMTAMHKATDNASELIRELRLQYNKARQATITKEILEIVSGAEALES